MKIFEKKRLFFNIFNFLNMLDDAQVKVANFGEPSPVTVETTNIHVALRVESTLSRVKEYESALSHMNFSCLKFWATLLSSSLSSY